MVLGVAATTAGVLPVFLVGALTVQIRRQLHFHGSGLGLVVAAFFVGATAGALLAARIADRIGLSRVMRLGTFGCAICLAGVATLAHSLLVLGIFMIIAGFFDGTIQPAVNGFLVGRVPRGRQGLALGIKQSAIPLSTLLGGLAVPAIALTVGWRWAFVAAGVLALATCVALPSHRRMGGRSRHRAAAPANARTHPASGSGDVPSGGSEPAFQLRALIGLAVAAGIGSGAANSFGAFLVSASVSAHIAEGTAGLLAAGGSVVGIVSRIVLASSGDRRDGGHFRVVAIMLALGGLGYGLLATGTPAPMVVGTALVFGAGWGWNGLFNYAVVRTHPRAPARATGITQAGVFVGAMVIPPVFGLVVDRSSFGVAWLLALVLAVLAAAVMVRGDHHAWPGAAAEQAQLIPPTRQ